MPNEADKVIRLTAEQQRLIQAKLESCARVAKRKAHGSGGSISADDLQQETILNEGRRLAHVGNEAFESSSSHAVRNPFRAAMAELKKFGQHPDPKFSLAEAVQQPDTQLPPSVEEKVHRIMEQLSVKQAAVWVRTEIGPGFGPHFEKYKAGISVEMEQQAIAVCENKGREPDSLRQDKRRGRLVATKALRVLGSILIFVTTGHLIGVITYGVKHDTSDSCSAQAEGGPCDVKLFASKTCDIRASGEHPNPSKDEGGAGDVKSLASKTCGVRAFWERPSAIKDQGDASVSLLASKTCDAGKRSRQFNLV